MPPKRPVRPRSEARALIATGVGLAHLGLLLLMAASLRRLEAPEPPEAARPTIPVEAAPLPAPLASSPRLRRLAKRRHGGPEPAPQPPSSPLSRWTLTTPSGPGGPPANGEPYGRDAPDDFAVREALRASVGCDLEGLKLRPDEQDRCDERAGFWAKRGRRIGPAGDDPKRAAELEAEEDYVRRLHAWKSWGGSPGAGDSLQDVLGPMPPKRTAAPPPPQ